MSCCPMLRVDPFCFVPLLAGTCTIHTFVAERIAVPLHCFLTHLALSHFTARWYLRSCCPFAMLASPHCVTFLFLTPLYILCLHCIKILRFLLSCLFFIALHAESSPPSHCAVRMPLSRVKSSCCSRRSWIWSNLLLWLKRSSDVWMICALRSTLWHPLWRSTFLPRLLNNAASPWSAISLARITPMQYWLHSFSYLPVGIPTPLFSFLFLVVVIIIHKHVARGQYAARSPCWALVVCMYALSWVWKGGRNPLRNDGFVFHFECRTEEQELLSFASK